ncbi:hypothetical protein CYFUS_002568 [Cystobacter fuscus]|uniref:Protein kinase n=1 Tax=Cystobacter fuscus TaxID=43 RepID=A0A250J119_9BACT|nr:hypothetical protein CYFUS_002568 [Cystobacter fuscus]
MDAGSHYTLSHLANMTPKKRWEWARVFISARQQGLGRLRLILFSVECARQLGTVVPFRVALRVVPRVAPTRGRVARAAWHAPPTWAPRAVGAIAMGIAIWGVLTLSEGPAPHAEMEVEDTEVPEWILTGQGDAGVVAKKMPSKRMKGQAAPPCTLPQVLLNDACWEEMKRTAPCEDFYEHEGRCYVPIVEKKRAPTSVDE